MKYVNTHFFTVLFCAFMFVCTPFLAKAQSETFRPFKVGVSLFTGYAFGGASEEKTESVTRNLINGEWISSTTTTTTATTGIGGLSIFYIEPQYAITDNIGVGLRYEAFVLGGGSIESTTTGGVASNVDATVKGGLTSAVTAQGDYFFTTTMFRPSVGLGLGLYTQAAGEVNIGVSVDGDSPGVDQAVLTENKSGLGLAPRARLNVGRFVLGLTYHYTLSEEIYNHFALNLGWEFGGGRR